MNLKMYFNGSDWVIAESPADATALLAAHIGDDSADEDELDWNELPMDKVQNIWLDPDGTVSAPGEDGATLVEMTVADEIAKFGRCYVGSADY